MADSAPCHEGVYLATHSFRNVLDERYPLRADCESEGGGGVTISTLYACQNVDNFHDF